MLLGCGASSGGVDPAAADKDAAPARDAENPRSDADTPAEAAAPQRDGRAADAAASLPPSDAAVHDAAGPVSEHDVDAASAGRADAAAMSSDADVDAAALTRPPNGKVSICTGDTCPHGECNDSAIFKKPACATAYPGMSVAPSSQYCNPGVTGAYCLTVGPDDYSSPTWLVTCSHGVASFLICVGACGGTSFETLTCTR